MLYVAHIFFCILVTLIFYLADQNPLYQGLIGAAPYSIHLVRWILFFLLGLPPIAFYYKYSREHRVRMGEESLHQLMIVSVLNELLREKEPAIEYHSKRVAQLVRALCERLGFHPKEARVIVFAALFHDIGKVFLDHKLLEPKQGPISPEEKKAYEHHPILGQRVLDSVQSYPGANLMVRHHHEWWDGTGFPEGIAGENIPFGARIISVADVYDATVHGLDFEEPRSPDESLLRVVSQKGKRFDPAIVDAFEKMMQAKTAAQAAPSPHSTA